MFPWTVVLSYSRTHKSRTVLPLKKKEGGIQSFETMGTTCPEIHHCIPEDLSSATLDVNSKCCTL